MREEVVQFGVDGSLLGILTVPDRETTPLRAVCIIPNSGMIHRVGPRRIAVKLARALAERGIGSFRIDLPGIGDSGHAGGSSPRERIVTTLGQAMSVLQELTGVGRFKLIGICSGGINGFWAAVADPRIDGVLMFDGFSYRSRLSRAAYYWARAKSLRRFELLAAIGRNVRRLLQRQPARQIGVELENLDSANPPRKEFVAHCNTLVARGCALHFVYGGGVLEYYSYAAQFADVFSADAFYAKATWSYLPSLDHMLSTRAAQQIFVAEVSDWIERLAPQPEFAATNLLRQLQAETAV